MPRVSFVHDWLTGMRGGEKCLDRFLTLYPDSQVHTLFHRPGSTTDLIESRVVATSWLQKLPYWQNYYRYLLPLFPRAARWNLPPCDLVVSLSHCVAKSAVPPAGTPHVCYCFTPMRYAWHMQHQYFGRSRLRDRLLARLREWDRRVSDRVTHFIAISETVRQRILECYERPSTVIYPPVDTDFYRPAPVARQDYYLVVSAFAPYKRIDHAIAACKRLKRDLVVIGTGQDARRLKSLAGSSVRFLGWQSDDAIRTHMQRCRALLFAGEEDFGIVPVEAQACGTPVIALGRGGATETVISWDGRRENATGLLYEYGEVADLAEAIAWFERCLNQFDPAAARRNAERFAVPRFDAEIRQYIHGILADPAVERRAA